MIPFSESLQVWLRVAAQSFGGPAAQIAVMHRIVVEEKRWVGESRFLHALNYCMLLPGPEAQQLATYLGWLMHGIPGGLVAGGLFVLPGWLALQALSMVYVLWHQVPLVDALFWGVQAAVLAVIAEAVDRVSKRVLKNGSMRLLAVLAFVAITALRIPFPLVVLGAGLTGLLGGRLAPARFMVLRGKETDTEAAGLLDAALDADALPHVRASIPRALAIAVIGLTLWLAPVAALRFARGPDDVYARLAAFFSGAAVVTFGGAYSVLAYVAQQAVQVHHWLTPDQMTHGLALAESTPGPLIQVVQFVGFLAAAGQPGSLPPLVAGTLGGLLVTWVTYAPSFLWVLLGGPWVERLRGIPTLTAALSAITAAVVGVIASLGVWLAAHVLFTAQQTVSPGGGVVWTLPDPASFDPIAAVIALAAGVALLRLHVSLGKVLVTAAVVGALVKLT